MFKNLLFSILGLLFSITAAEAACSSYPYTLTNGTTADATQVMADFNCAALTLGATLVGPTLSPVGNQAATVASSGYGTMGIFSDIAAGGISAPGLYSYGSGMGFGVAGSINFVTGTGGNTLSATIAQNGNLTVYGSGTTCVIGSGTGATSCTSDARLKVNTREITGSHALNDLSKIRAVTYNWADPGKDQNQQVGVIAQEVQRVFPQLVGSATAAFKGERDRYLTVDYAGLVSPLIGAVNELNRRVSLLRARNAHQTDEIRDLHTRDLNEITELRAEIAALRREFHVQTAQR